MRIFHSFVDIWKHRADLFIFDLYWGKIRLHRYLKFSKFIFSAAARTSTAPSATRWSPSLCLDPRKVRTLKKTLISSKTLILLLLLLKLQMIKMTFIFNPPQKRQLLLMKEQKTSEKEILRQMLLRTWFNTFIKLGEFFFKTTLVDLNLCEYNFARESDLCDKKKNVL